MVKISKAQRKMRRLKTLYLLTSLLLFAVFVSGSLSALDFYKMRGLSYQETTIVDGEIAQKTVNLSDQIFAVLIVLFLLALMLKANQLCGMIEDYQETVKGI